MTKINFNEFIILMENFVFYRIDNLSLSVLLIGTNTNG